MDTSKVNIYFMIPNGREVESEASEIMQTTYQLCDEYKLNTQWLEQENYKSISFSKLDVLVFDKFEGEVFEEVKKTKSIRIIGPWCLCQCMSKCIKIPNLNCPIYNLAMLQCLICVSGLKAEEKTSIKHFVQKMGGYFTTDLQVTVTHLVTDSTLTTKYYKAAQANIKIMTPEWITAVWEKSQNSPVHCDDEEFQSYKCKALHKLRISVTGFTSQKREKLQKLITENGGIYFSTFSPKLDNFLICEKSGPVSSKIIAARNSNVPCVTEDWLEESIKKGYALDKEGFTLSAKTSTPTKGGMDPNFSTISALSCTSANNDSQKILAETLNVSNVTNMDNYSPLSTESRKRKSTDDQVDYNYMVDSINLKEVKNAGQFLDGCGVYVVGFANEQREKLIKIINGSGATRYDGPSHQITHVLVGDTSSRELRLLKNYHCVCVGISWLLESISNKGPANETPYLININYYNEAVSPLSKKSLRCEKTVTEETLKENVEVVHIQDDEPDLLQQYLQPNATDREDSLALMIGNQLNSEAVSCDENMDNNSSDKLFAKYTFRVCSGVGFEDDVLEKIEAPIEESCGKIIKDISIQVDYCIVPVFIEDELFLDDLNCKEVVTDLWLTECCEEKVIPQTNYFHRPLKLKGTPLTDCVITLSGYSGYERNYLSTCITRLGGIFQENFSKYTRSESGPFASTHLVSLNDTGSKYTAALKWKKPVVNKDWLLDCARQNSKLDEQNYLVGDSVITPTTPARSSSSRESVIEATNTVKPSEAAKTIPANDKNANGIFKTVTTPIQNPRLTAISGGSSGKSSKTPPNNRLDSPFCSQVTPVSKIMEDLKLHTLMKTPEGVAMSVKEDTPNTPLERLFVNETNKQLRKDIHKLAERYTSRKSTPISELKRQFWQKINPYGAQKPSTSCEFVAAEEDPELDENLRKLDEFAKKVDEENQNGISLRKTYDPSAGCARKVKDSQPNTVTWEDDDFFNDMTAANTNTEKRKCFIFSSLPSETRGKLSEMVDELNGILVNASNFDINSTHVICAKPSRNEKILSAMASGKWILHSDYIENSKEAGHWLDEEEYEFGNPRFKVEMDKELSKDAQKRAKSMYWWRLEIQRRGYGAFNDMRAIIIANNKDNLKTVIESGGGIVVEAQPPFREEVHATHCFLELKTVKDISTYIPLAEQGIYCLPTLYIADFLDRTTEPDVRSCVIPHFKRYY